MSAVRHIQAEVEHVKKELSAGATFVRSFSEDTDSKRSKEEEKAAKDKIKVTNKSGAELHGRDLMPFFDDKTGEVNSEILRQSGPKDLYPFAHSVIHERKRYFVMGKRKVELAREGTMTDLFCHNREKRRAKRRADIEDKMMKQAATAANSGLSGGVATSDRPYLKMFTRQGTKPSSFSSIREMSFKSGRSKDVHPTPKDEHPKSERITPHSHGAGL